MKKLLIVLLLVGLLMTGCAGYSVPLAGGNGSDEMTSTSTLDAAAMSATETEVARQDAAAAGKSNEDDPIAIYLYLNNGTDSQWANTDTPFDPNLENTFAVGWDEDYGECMLLEGNGDTGNHLDIGNPHQVDDGRFYVFVYPSNEGRTNYSMHCDEKSFSVSFTAYVPTPTATTPAPTDTPPTSTSVPPTATPTSMSPTATTAAGYTPELNLVDGKIAWTNLADVTEKDIVDLFGGIPSDGCDALTESMITIHRDGGTGPNGYISIQVPDGTCVSFDNPLPMRVDGWISNAKETSPGSGKYEAMDGSANLVSGHVREVCGLQATEILIAWLSPEADFLYTGIPGYAENVPVQGTVYIWWIETRFDYATFDHLMVDRLPDGWVAGNDLCLDFLTEISDADKIPAP